MKTKMLVKNNLLIALTFFILSLVISPALWAATTKQVIEPRGTSGGKFYSVKVYHYNDVSTDYLMGNERGLQIYTKNSYLVPRWRDQFPDATADYAGGGAGLDIANFKTAVDAMKIGTQNYAFYADGVKLYIIRINPDSTIDPNEVDSYGIANVRAVTVAQIPQGGDYYYAFALAYRPQVNIENQDPLPPNTILYVFDVSTPSNMLLKASVLLDTDEENANITGACDIVYVADIDNNSAADYDSDGDYEDPYLFIADGVEGIKAVDITGLVESTPSFPGDADVYTADTDGTATGIDAAPIGSYFYALVADGTQGLKIFNVSDPANNMPLDDEDKVSELSFTAGYAYDVKLFGTTAFIANGVNGVQVVDVSDPNNPVDITLGDASDDTYIDSCGQYNRLNGTAYDVDLDVTADYQLLPVVAWGESGLIQTNINILDDATNDVVESINDYVIDTDGTMYISRSDGRIRSVDTTSSTMTTLATSAGALLWDASDDYLISLGNYLYGIATSGDEIIRILKSNFATTSTTTMTCQDITSDLYTDGTSIYFIDDASKDIYAVNASTMLLDTSSDEITDFSSDVGVISLGDYIYAVLDPTADIVYKTLKTDLSAGTMTIDFTDDVIAFFTDGTYVFCLENNGSIARIDSSDTTTDLGRKAFSVGNKNLVVQNGYIYGENGGYLARIKTTFANGDPPATSDISITANSRLAGDGQDIYVNDGGRITKISVNLFDTTGDGIKSPGVLVRNNTKIICDRGYVFGIDDVSPDGMCRLAFTGTEASADIAIGGNANFKQFGGFCKDIALVNNTGAGSDYVYIADGGMGIRRYTINDFDDPSTWTELICTDTSYDPSVTSSLGDVTDDWDITDARGIDVVGSTVVLVADGTKGVKLVKTDLPANPLKYDTDNAWAHGNGYISQYYSTASESLTNSTTAVTGAAAEDIEYFTYDTTLSDDYAVVANGSEGLVILNLDKDGDGNLGDMYVEARVALNTDDGYAYGVAVDTYNYYAYVAAGTEGLVIIDLDPNNAFADANCLPGGTYIYESPPYIASYEARSVTLDDPTNPSYAYISYGRKGIIALDVSDPSSPQKVANYPTGAQVDGVAYDASYYDDTLFVAMGPGKILSLDVTDPSAIYLRGSVDTHGDALGIVYDDLSSDGGINQLFVANGRGGLLSTQIRWVMEIDCVAPNIQPQVAGDYINIIGSGFIDENDDKIQVLIDGNIIDPNIVIVKNRFELSFPAPAKDVGVYDITLQHKDGILYPATALSAVQYLPEGDAIIDISAVGEDPNVQGGMASPGGMVPLDLILHNNGAGDIVSAKALIKYDKDEFKIPNEDGSINQVGYTDSTVFALHSDLTDLTATSSIIDLDASDDYLHLMVSIYGTETFSTTEAPTNRINLGRLSMTISDALAGDQTLILDNRTGQEVSFPNDDVSPASGSRVSIYIKEAPKMEITYASQSYEAGSTQTFGDFTVEVTEILDSDVKIENAKITFSTESNALVDADGVNNVFTIYRGTLDSGSSRSSSPISVLSTDLGLAGITMNVGTIAGTYTMNITGLSADGSTLTGSPTNKIFTIVAETDPGDADDSITLTPNTQTPSPGDTVTITITAYDRYGNTMTSEDVDITTTDNKGTLSVTSGRTDSNGQITTNLKLENSIATHTVNASYDNGQTTASLAVTPLGPDVNADGTFDISDIQKAIIYHINWTDLSGAPKPVGKSYVPGDTNHNNRFDLNEVVAIINLSMELSE